MNLLGRWKQDMFMSDGSVIRSTTRTSQGARWFLNRIPLVVGLVVVVMASVIAVGLGTALNIAESAYSDLLSEYDEISRKYEILSGSYDRLREERDNLTERYDEFARRYRWLDPPLKNKSIPSTAELRIWLESDRTDEYEYVDPDLTCYQFSVLPMLHGRAQHYDIGVVAIHGYRNETGESFSHSINAIIAAEGLVYVEPQLDEVWWLEDHSGIERGTMHTFPGSEDLVHVEEISIFFDYR